MLIVGSFGSRQESYLVFMYGIYHIYVGNNQQRREMRRRHSTCVESINK